MIILDTETIIYTHPVCRYVLLKKYKNYSNILEKIDRKKIIQ